MFHGTHRSIAGLVSRCLPSLTSMSACPHCCGKRLRRALPQLRDAPCAMPSTTPNQTNSSPGLIGSRPSRAGSAPCLGATATTAKRRLVWLRSSKRDRPIIDLKCRRTGWLGSGRPTRSGEAHAAGFNLSAGSGCATLGSRFGHHWSPFVRQLEHPVWALACQPGRVLSDVCHRDRRPRSVRSRLSGSSGPDRSVHCLA